MFALKRVSTVHLLLAGLLASLPYGCSDDEGETTGTSGSGVPSTATTTSTSTSGSGGSGGGTGGMGPCFEASGGYGGFGEVCMMQPGDNACIGCARSNCCAQVETCSNDAQCSCLLQCFTDNCDPIACLQLCGQNPAVNELVMCATGSCGNDCVGN